MQTDQIRWGNRPYTGRFVSECALVHRINRRLTWRAQKLTKSRGAREKQQLGEWCIVDLSSFGENGPSCEVVRGFIDLEALGRALGCLAPDDEYRPLTSPPTPRAVAGPSKEVGAAIAGARK
jgi:hypothetical protein